MTAICTSALKEDDDCLGRKVKNPRAVVIENFGRRMTIPARPCLGWNEADRAILAIMANELSA